MSLRIIIKPPQIERWIADRNGTPARRRGTDADVRVLFGETAPEYDTISMDELIEALQFNHLVLLVDDEPGKTYHKIYKHG